MGKGKSKTTHIRISNFAKDFAAASGELYPLKKLVSGLKKELKIKDLDHIPADQALSLTAFGCVYSAAQKEMLLSSDDPYPLITKAGVKKFVKKHKDFPEGLVKQGTIAVYKALLSAAFNGDKKIRFVKGEPGRRPSRLLKKQGHKAIDRPEPSSG